jgi:hypothetical protein
MLKVICESGRNVRYEYDVNHARKVFDCSYQELFKEERQLLEGLGMPFQDWLDQILCQSIARDRKIKTWHSALSHYCGGHSNCDHPADQRYWWKNRDILEPQMSLQRYLANDLTIIRKLTHSRGQYEQTSPFMPWQGKTPTKA